MPRGVPETQVAGEIVMKTKVSRCHVYPIGNVRQYGWILAVLFGFLIHSNAHAFNLTVVGSDGQLVAGFRWLMEEDATQFSVTGVSAEPEVNYSLSFHTSYMPVVTKSSQAINDIAVDATKRFKLIVEGFNNKERVDSLCIRLKNSRDASGQSDEKTNLS
jgi:hypothetical protein